MIEDVSGVGTLTALAENRWIREVRQANDEYNAATELYQQRLRRAAERRYETIKNGKAKLYVKIMAEWLGIEDYGREVRLRVGDREFILNHLQAQTAGKMTEPVEEDDGSE